MIQSTLIEAGGLGAKGKYISILDPSNTINTSDGTSSSEEEALQLAKKKLKHVSILNRVPYKARRKLRRLIAFANAKQIRIPHEVVSLINLSQDTRESSLIVDSGTLFNIHRNKDDFCRITDQRIRISGVAGGSYGYRGFLKPSELGIGIEAIWFKDLPVNALLSVEGLKKDYWETLFLLHTNVMRNKRTGSHIYMSKCKVTNLPSIRINYTTQIDEIDPKIAFLNSPTSEMNFDNTNNISDPEDDNNLYPDQVIPPLDNKLAGISARDANPTTRKRPREQHKPKLKPKVSKLLQHQRMAHMHEPNNKVRCLDCLECKGKRGGASKERPESYKTRAPFLLFSADFFGKVSPQSISGNNWTLAFICDECGYAHAETIPAKRDAPEALERFTKTIRAKCGASTMNEGPREIIVGGIHTDNEPVLTGQRWKATCDRLGITELHSIPYVPQGNGTIERFIGTLKNALRTTMRGVDARVWDWAVKHCVEVWNLKNNNKCCKFNDGKICCPNTILSQLTTNPFLQKKQDRKHYLRRFGCLAFFKPYKSPKELEDLRNKVLLPTRMRGIHLGFSVNNSAWLIGSVNDAGHFTTYETRDVSFCEDILVRDVRALSVRWEPDLPSHIESTSKLSVKTETSTTVGAEKSAVGECAQYQLEGCMPTRWIVPLEDDSGPLRTDTVGTLEAIGKPKGVPYLKSNISGKPPMFGIEATDVEDPLLGNDPQGKISIDKYWDKIDEKKENIKTGKEVQQTPIVNEAKEVSQSDGTEKSLSEVQFGPTAENRRRGRPRGSKDLQKRNRKTKKQMREGPNAGETKKAIAFLAAADEADFYSHLAMEVDEEIEEVHMFLAKEGVESKPGDSVKQSWAFSPNNPERPKWIEAKEKEEIRLNAYNTWRKLTDDEEILWRQGKIKAVPTALLLTRKRCGRYKGRLVVLGNRWQPDEVNNVYASVVSQVGNRATLVHAAKLGMEVIPFDIGNAFIRASMDSLKVVVTIPDTFRDKKSNDSGRRMLLKALYGLPVSPRLWAKCLGKDLKELGWVECVNEPGVWRKHDSNNNIIGYLTVYVDDCVLCAKDRVTVEAELDLIHKKHPLSVIECTPTSKGGIRFDLTGADIEYTAKRNTVSISMENYIRKLLTKYDMLQATPLATPSFEEKTLYDPKAKASDFPYKSAIGALQWATTCGRPDIAHSVNMLARAGANPCTTAMAKCVRIVFRYLVGTLEYAIEYSPEQEQAFYKEYYRIASEEAENKSWAKDANTAKEAVHLFTDASFGVEFKTMKSVSGIAVYLHGCIIAWRSKVQTIMTNCTTQSEWVALSEGLEFSSTIYGLHRFLTGSKETEPLAGPAWCDNRGAALIGRKGPDAVDEIPRRSRHICLRYAAVLQEHKRLFWCPTAQMKADGLTKSANAEALRSLFLPPKSLVTKVNEVELPEEEVDCYTICNLNYPTHLYTTYHVGYCVVGGTKLSN